MSTPPTVHDSDRKAADEIRAIIAEKCFILLSHEALAEIIARHHAEERAAVENIERYIIDIREKAALIANNAPEEKERFLARQIILLCEKSLAQSLTALRTASQSPTT